ncbi:MAG: DUF4238 domain-containing protein [Pseudorhodoplanes sp.]|nr:DUF4238 domain-containing protein [Pseudorhodoplanes sp.]
MALDHYVSQVHLKRFYSPTLGDLMHAVRKSDLKSFTPRAQDVCRIDEGNTNDYLVEPRAIEEFLKPVESRYNAAISVLQGGTSKLDHETIYVVAGFASYVLTCSPAAMRINSEPLKANLESTTKLLESIGEMPPPPPELGGKDFAELLESGKVKFKIDPKFPQAIGVSNILRRVAMFGNFRWDILINEHVDCPFFTSDFPTALEETSEFRVLNRIFPLTPTLAIRVVPNINVDSNTVNYEFRHFSFQRRKVTRQESININRLLVQSAEDAVFFRDDQAWVAKFIEKNRSFRVETETIEIPQPRGVMLWSRQAIRPFRRG